MALFTPGVAVGIVSGRVGGTIFSHNRGGAYMRNGVKPHVVTSDAAQLQKYILSVCSRAWATLTDAERAAWKSYAVENPTINRIGQSRTLSGHQAFNAINARILRSSGTALDVPPTAAPPSPLYLTSFTVDTTPGTASIVFTDTPLPAGVTLWAWAAVTSGPGVSYVANRMRLVTVSAAAAASPLDIYADLLTRFGTLQVGQEVHLKIQACDSTTGLVSGFAGISTTVT